MSGFRFKDQDRDVLGEVVYGEQPQPTQPLLAGKFTSVEALAAAFEELERQDSALDEQLRNANMNEIFWGGR